MSGAVRVEGLRSLDRALKSCDLETDEWLRAGLLRIGENAAVNVRNVYGDYSSKGANGVQARVARTGNVVVRQTVRKSLRPQRRRHNFGPLMFRRAFLPALIKSRPYTEHELDRLMRDLEARFDD